MSRYDQEEKPYEYEKKILKEEIERTQKLINSLIENLSKSVININNIFSNIKESFEKKENFKE